MAPVEARGERAELVAWRTTVQGLLERLRGWSREHYAAALDAYLAERFGDVSRVDHADDLTRAADDLVCAPGSAGDAASILSVFCQQAFDVDPAEREQARRWERERRRGVFVLQRAVRDQLVLWDPLEGAPLTLHLLEKLPDAEVARLPRGTVATAVYQPWLARLFAVGVEFFGDPQALRLFREEIVGSGAPWHEPPAPAPEKTRSAAQTP